MGWFSGIESKWLTRLSVALWQQFADDLRLEEARKAEFSSLRDCFIRELRDGARPIDPREDIIVSPCDAIVGECGRMSGTTLFQAKGFPYELADLIPDAALQHRYRDGIFITLRLKSSMYHRFHAPLACDAACHLHLRRHLNVNPSRCAASRSSTVKRAGGDGITYRGAGQRICLVAVAAILVAASGCTA
jgi:phosphatidylserine decarboxylase